MLAFRKVALRRGPVLLFEDAEFRIHAGWKAGLTGRNGSGKSSLFALLLGELGPDAGDIDIPAQWRIAHVAQEAPSSSETALAFTLAGDTELAALTAELASTADDARIASLHGAIEAIDGYHAELRAIRILDGLGFDEAARQAPVHTFSGGWRMRLALARTLMMRADLLLLDEPTNHLDLDASLWLEQWLQRFEGTLLLISHDRDFMDRVCGHILHIEHGSVELSRGNYSAFEEKRAMQLSQQQQAFEKQQREVAAIESFVNRFRAKASKARQAQSRLKALARMSSIAPAHVDSPFHFEFADPGDMPAPLVTLTQAGAGYGDSRVLRAVNLGLMPGARLGLVGPNGAGKTTLVRLIAGELPPAGGERLVHRNTRIGYFAQQRVEMLDDSATPLQQLQRLDPGAGEQALRNFLGGFAFGSERAMKPTAVLSGGERARLALAMIVRQGPNVLLLDEPTNHLDMDMRLALNLALQAFSGAVVLVSHDRHLLRTVCDELLLVAGGDVTPFDGDLDDYGRLLAQRLAGSAGPEAAGANGAGRDRRAERQAAARRRQSQAPLRKEMAALETRLEALQQRQREIEAALADPTLYEPGESERLGELNRDRARAASELAAMEERWLSLGEALEAAGSAD